MAAPDEKVPILHDGKLTIATGSSRLTKVWKNKEILWSEFVARLDSFIAAQHQPQKLRCGFV